MVCHTHGWKNLSPYSWDDDTDSIQFAVLVDNLSVDISATQKNDIIKVSVVSHEKLNKPTLKNN